MTRLPSEPASPISRRALLSRCANGFGAVAMSALLADSASGFGANRRDRGSLLPGLHHPARASRVIFLYMDGGPSQVDTFDPKPRLDRDHGRPIAAKVEPTQFDDIGNVLRSPWRFRNRGESGTPVSDLFPQIGAFVDDMAVIRSMVSNFSEHTNANYFLHTCHGQQGRPSAGAWVTYGLGSESRDLPGFAVLNGGLIPPGGLDCFGSGFLPAAYQGSVFMPTGRPIANIEQPEPTADLQRRKLDLVRAMDLDLLDRSGANDALEAAIENAELAFRMQSAVPDLVAIDGESSATQRMYGLDDPYPPTRIYARQCLLARRLVERGVRFVELTCPGVGHDRWDQHSNLKAGHEDNARAVDRPIAGLLADLKGRGLLDETLVVWGGEFGRTPMAQGTDGRDHNPHGFSIWMAGGGIGGGTIHGATDDYGYHAIADRVEVYDLHATILHLLGIDHTRLTYRFGGRDVRLTDVHGQVVQPILA